MLIIYKYLEFAWRGDRLDELGYDKLLVIVTIDQISSCSCRNSDNISYSEIHTLPSTGTQQADSSPSYNNHST